MRLLAAAVLVAGGLVLALRAQAERVARVAISAPDAVLIAGGFFGMGSDDEDISYAVALCSETSDDSALCRPELFLDEQPLHRVYVSAFRIDRSEVSQRAYQRC